MPSHSKQSMSSVNIKSQSSEIKIKSKNRRKHRKKRKQKSSYNLCDIPKMSNIPKYNIDKTTYNASSATQNQMAVAKMWTKSYETIMRWQCQHQIEYWKNLAVNRNVEIRRLREMLQNYDRNIGVNIEDVDTDDEFSDIEKPTDQSDAESESYLKFLEITLRHRQERNHSNINSNDDET